MTEKHIIVDRKLVANWLIMRKAIEKYYEDGFDADTIAALFVIAEVPDEYLEVPEEIIRQYIELDNLIGGDYNE